MSSCNGGETDSTSLWEGTICHHFCSLPQSFMIPSVFRIKFFRLFSMLFVACSQTAFLLLTPYKSCCFLHFRVSLFSKHLPCSAPLHVLFPLSGMSSPFPPLPQAHSLLKVQLQCCFSQKPLLLHLHPNSSPLPGLRAFLVPLLQHFFPVIWEQKLAHD